MLPKMRSNKAKGKVRKYNMPKKNQPAVIEMKSPPMAKKSNDMAKMALHVWKREEHTTEKNDQVVAEQVLSYGGSMENAPEHVKAKWARLAADAACEEMGVDSSAVPELSQAAADHLMKTNFGSAVVFTKWGGLKAAENRMILMNEYALENQVEVAINPVDLICIGAQLWCRRLSNRTGTKMQNLIKAHHLREKFPMTVASWIYGQSHFYVCHKVPNDIRTNFKVLGGLGSFQSSDPVKKQQTTVVVDDSDGEDGEGGTSDSVDEVADEGNEATQVSDFSRPRQGDFIITLRPEGLISSLNTRMTEKPYKIPHDRRVKTAERALYTESQAVEAYDEIKAYLTLDASDADKSKVGQALTKELIPYLPMEKLGQLGMWAAWSGMDEMAKTARGARKLGDDKPTCKSYEQTKDVEMPFTWSARPLLSIAAEIHQWAEFTSHPDVFIRLGNMLMDIAEDHREHLSNQDREMETLRQLIDKFAIRDDQGDQGGQRKASLIGDPPKTRKRRRVNIEDDESDDDTPRITTLTTSNDVQKNVEGCQMDEQEKIALRFGAQALASAKKAGGSAKVSLLSYMRKMHPDELVDRIVEECTKLPYAFNA